MFNEIMHVHHHHNKKEVVCQAFFPAEKQQILGKCCTTDRCPQNRCNRLIMLYQGKIVVDVKGEEKKNLTVEDLMRLFHQNSGETLVSDELVLG